MHTTQEQESLENSFVYNDPPTVLEEMIIFDNKLHYARQDLVERSIAICTNTRAIWTTDEKKEITCIECRIQLVRQAIQIAIRRVAKAFNIMQSVMVKAGTKIVRMILIYRLHQILKLLIIQKQLDKRSEAWYTNNGSAINRKE